jgi:hypothetical protein
MKWKVEYVTDTSCNVLIDDPALPDIDKEPVGMGFPIKLAERIVDLHNKEIERLSNGRAT